MRQDSSANTRLAQAHADFSLLVLILNLKFITDHPGRRLAWLVCNMKPVGSTQGFYKGCDSNRQMDPQPKRSGPKA